jgi:hypothetical protein
MHQPCLYQIDNDKVVLVCELIFEVRGRIKNHKAYVDVFVHLHRGKRKEPVKSSKNPQEGFLIHSQGPGESRTGVRQGGRMTHDVRGRHDEMTSSLQGSKGGQRNSLVEQTDIGRAKSRADANGHGTGVGETPCRQTTRGPRRMDHGSVQGCQTRLRSGFLIRLRSSKISNTFVLGP